jgi:hypothetical protein
MLVVGLINDRLVPGAESMAVSSGPAKHRMRADAAPDDVHLAGLNLVSVFEGRAAIRRPAHLPYAGVSLNPLDAQPWMEA